MALRSYVNGSWASPAEEGVPLLDAVTGEQIDTVSSAGDIGPLRDGRVGP